MTFLHHLLSPETLGVVVTLGGIGWKAVRTVKVKFDEDTNKLAKTVSNQLTEFREESVKAHKGMEMEITRLQLLEGMDAHRLSTSEAAYFYDKYRKLGGNSFVTEKYHQYIKDLEEEEDKEDENRD